MSVGRRSNLKRSSPLKNAVASALDSDNAGISSIGQLWSAEATSVEAAIRQEGDSALCKGVLKQYGSSAPSEHNQLFPFSETRVDDTIPESSDVVSLSEQSNESHRLEIHRLRLEVAALTMVSEPHV